MKALVMLAALAAPVLMSLGGCALAAHDYDDGYRTAYYYPDRYQRDYYSRPYYRRPVYVAPEHRAAVIVRPGGDRFVYEHY